jgi:type I restriction enzyme S subunit
VLDAPANGGTVRMRRHQLARAGQMIVSEIWAKRGAVGIVPPGGAGALVTSHFFLFDLDESRLDRGFLYWLLRANWLEAQLAAVARGTTGYASVRPAHILACRVPLPSLAEQRRLTDQIEALSSLLDEVGALMREVETLSQELCRAIIMNATRATPVAMGSLVKLRPTDVVVAPDESYQFAGIYSFGRGVFRGERRDGLSTSYKRLTTLRAGDLVYPKLMAWEGAFGVVPNECDGCVVSPEFPVFEVDTTRVLPEVLDTYFRTPSVWPRIAGSSTGTNVRRRRLNPQDFLAYSFPLPPMSAQEDLRAVRAKVDAMLRLRSEITGGAAALLPAVLNQVLTGVHV